MSASPDSQDLPWAKHMFVGEPSKLQTLNSELATLKHEYWMKGLKEEINKLDQARYNFARASLERKALQEMVKERTDIWRPNHISRGFVESHLQAMRAQEEKARVELAIEENFRRDQWADEDRAWLNGEREESPQRIHHESLASLEISRLAGDKKMEEKYRVERERSSNPQLYDYNNQISRFERERSSNPQLYDYNNQISRFEEQNKIRLARAAEDTARLITSERRTHSAIETSLSCPPDFSVHPLSTQQQTQGGENREEQKTKEQRSEEDRAKMEDHFRQPRMFRQQNKERLTNAREEETKKEKAKEEAARKRRELAEKEANARCAELARKRLEAAEEMAKAICLGNGFPLPPPGMGELELQTYTLELCDKKREENAREEEAQEKARQLQVSKCKEAAEAAEEIAEMQTKQLAGAAATTSASLTSTLNSIAPTTEAPPQTPDPLSFSATPATPQVQQSLNQAVRSADIHSLRALISASCNLYPHMRITTLRYLLGDKYVEETPEAGYSIMGVPTSITAPLTASKPSAAPHKNDFVPGKAVVIDLTSDDEDMSKNTSRNVLGEVSNTNAKRNANPDTTEPSAKKRKLQTLDTFAIPQKKAEVRKFSGGKCGACQKNIDSRYIDSACRYHSGSKKMTESFLAMIKQYPEMTERYNAIIRANPHTARQMIEEEFAWAEGWCWTCCGVAGKGLGCAVATYHRDEPIDSAFLMNTESSVYPF